MKGAAIATTLQLTLRRTLARAIRTRVESWGLTRDAAARKLGVTRPRLSALVAGEVNLFSLDTLVALAAKAGLTIRISATRSYRRI
jgi:predicted XRE-type DNA-binding protein